MSLLDNAFLSEEQLRRIVGAARAKGITIEQMQADSKKMLRLVKHVLTAAQGDRAKIDEIVRRENYDCLACRSDIHNLCVNDRLGVVMPMKLCQCIHQKGEPNGHDN